MATSRGGFAAGCRAADVEAITVQVHTGWTYDVTADGQRFLINTLISETNPPLTVVLDWTAGLGR